MLSPNLLYINVVYDVSIGNSKSHDFSMLNLFPKSQFSQLIKFIPHYSSLKTQIVFLTFVFVHLA
jgi:hypothetical protein